MKLLNLVFLINIYSIINIPFYEVYKIIMNDNITRMDRTSYKFVPKGVLLTFDPNSNISSIPSQIEFEIKNGFYTVIEGSDPYEKDLGNGYQALITHVYMDFCFPAVNFILDKKAITIPSKYLFKNKGYFEFIFLIKEGQDRIIIGKDLIDLMGVEFLNEREFVIKNKEFVVTIKDIQF